MTQNQRIAIKQRQILFEQQATKLAQSTYEFIKYEIIAFCDKFQLDAKNLAWTSGFYIRGTITQVVTDDTKELEKLIDWYRTVVGTDMPFFTYLDGVWN